jgi:hypothetical protein
MLLLMIISSWDRDTADEQNATSPPCGVLDVFRHFTNSFWSLRDIQCLHRNSVISIKIPSETYLFVPHCSYFDNTRHLTRNGSPLWLLEFR